MKLKFYSQLIFILQLGMLTKEASNLHIHMYELVFIIDCST